MPSIVKGPYLQWPTRDAITIMWETSSTASSAVSYWETEKQHSGLSGRFKTLASSEKIVEDGAKKCIHAMRLTGLEPETIYHYKVRSVDSRGKEVESAEYPLKTAVEPETPFSFAVTSETGGYGDDQINRRLFAQIGRWRPDFLLLVGDVVSHGLNYEDWGQWFFAPARELLYHTPFYLCLGNHEENAPFFYELVRFPKPRNYYSFDYGNVHFTALDSTALVDYKEGRPVSTEALRPGSPQWEFLVADLRQSQAQWKIVFFHYPPYVAGDFQVEEMRALCPVLEEHGVDRVFNSHTIVYERSHPLRNDRLDPDSGIIYIVAGGAGAKPDWLHHKRAWHTAQAVAVPHFLQVVAAGRRLEVHAFDVAGQLFDTFVLDKGRNP